MFKVENSLSYQNTHQQLKYLTSKDSYHIFTVGFLRLIQVHVRYKIHKATFFHCDHNILYYR